MGFLNRTQSVQVFSDIDPVTGLTVPLVTGRSGLSHAIGNGAGQGVQVVILTNPQGQLYRLHAVSTDGGDAYLMTGGQSILYIPAKSCIVLNGLVLTGGVAFQQVTATGTNFLIVYDQVE